MSALVHTAALLTSGGSSDSVLKLSVLGHIGDGGLGDEDQAGDRSSVLQGDAADLDGVEDAHLDHVAPLAVGRVETLAGGQLGNLVDHDSALKASVLGDGSDRSGQSLLDDVDADLLLGVVNLDSIERRSSVHEGDAATGDDALLDSSTGCLQGVLDAVLDFLELGLGSSADLDDGNAAGELGQALLELLAVEVRGGVLHLALDLSDAGVDGLLGASAADNDGVVLGDGDGLSGTEHIGGNVSDLHAQLVQSSLTTGEDGDVLVNMIDPFHLDAYGVTTVNYNRDVEIFPVLDAIFERIYGENPYKSPTDMGVNMAGNCICDDDACREASNQEIIRRYYAALNGLAEGTAQEEEAFKIELLMKQAHITVEDRKVVDAALKRAEETNGPAAAMELPNGQIITGKTSCLLGASSALLLNALKNLAGLNDELHLISPSVIEPIQKLKTEYLGSINPRLHTDEILIALSICAATDDNAKLALEQIPKLSGCQAHTSVMLSSVDIKQFKRLNVQLTSEAKYENKRIYH